MNRAILGVGETASGVCVVVVLGVENSPNGTGTVDDGFGILPNRRGETSFVTKEQNEGRKIASKDYTREV